MCASLCVKQGQRDREREREFCGKRTADLRILRTAVSRTHAEIQSQKQRGFRLSIHTAPAKPPTLAQIVISTHKQAFLYVFDRLHKHMHPNTVHTLNIRNFCVLTDVSVSTHRLLRLNGWGQCRPTNTHSTVCGSANAEPISYIDMARALMREREREGQRKRERKRDREDKGEKKSIPYLNTKHKPSQSSRSVQLAT